MNRVCFLQVVVLCLFSIQGSFAEERKCRLDIAPEIVAQYAVPIGSRRCPTRRDFEIEREARIQAYERSIQDPYWSPHTKIRNDHHGEFVAISDPEELLGKLISGVYVDLANLTVETFVGYAIDDRTTASGKTISIIQRSRGEKRGTNFEVDLPGNSVKGFARLSYQVFPLPDSEPKLPNPF